MSLFRRARPARTSWNAAKTLVQVLVFWGVFLVAAPPRIASWAAGHVSRDRFTPAQPVAALLFVMASAAGVLSAVALVRFGRGTPLPTDAPRALVTQGPYRWVRNPMAVAGVVQGVAVGLWWGSWSVIGFFLCGALFWHVAIRPFEEADLRLRFGDAYERYRRLVPLWVPLLRRRFP